MVGVLIQLSELYVVIEQQDSAERVCIQNVDRLEFCGAMHNALGNRSGHGQAVAANRERQVVLGHESILLSANVAGGHSALHEILLVILFCFPKLARR